ncbi:MAG: SMC-Scp complex subunit ScpB [Phycisphaerae bacterium]|nr:SMC-Scp complex subunit ScpB [Phycisphaerae bacterium]
MGDDTCCEAGCLDATDWDGYIDPMTDELTQDVPSEHQDSRPAGGEVSEVSDAAEPGAEGFSVAADSRIPGEGDGDGESSESPVESEAAMTEAAEEEEEGGDEADAEVEADRVSLESGQTIEAETVVEAILFATDTPLAPKRIAQVMGVGDGRSVRKHIKGLNKRYEEQGAAFRIEEVAGGFQMLTLSDFNPWLRQLLRARQDSRLSPAALETLAIVAYKQPVLRAEVEAIRGVAVGEVMNRLREMNLIKIVGRDEQIGRPMLYGTTKRFLEVFGLASLKDLPKVEELKLPE